VIARRGRGAALAALLALGAMAGAQEGAATQPRAYRPFDPEGFARAMAQAGAKAEAIDAFRKDAAEAAGPAADALLRAVYRDYDAAARAAEEGKPEAALQLAKVVAGAQDPYLRAHARYQLGRVFLDADEPAQAAQVLQDYLKDDTNRTPLDAEAAWFYSDALGRVPLVEEAIQNFRAFLKLFPNAPERFLVGAKRALADLEMRQESALHGLADSMKDVERRIRKTDTGEDTQARQKQIIERLAKILEEIEEQERQSGAPGGNSQRPTAPASSSQAPPGASRIGNLNRLSGVADRWDAMAQREREAIETEVQTKLPPRYQKMLEEYYRRLGGSR
jgi:tetratricopeptide (TPR) repeat protein